MTRKEWLERQSKNAEVTFIKMKSVQDENSPYYHSEFMPTAIYTVWQWLANTNNDEYIIINPDHPPIDITGAWGNWYNKGHLLCAVITTEAELRKQYSEQQVQNLIAHYDREARR